MKKYIIIAGAAPILHKKKVVLKKGELVKAIHVIDPINPLGKPILEEGARYVQKGDILQENYFETTELIDLLKGKFIEEYKPVKITDADLKAHPHLSEHFNLKKDSEIHESPTHGIYKQTKKVEPGYFKKNN